MIQRSQTMSGFETYATSGEQIGACLDEDTWCFSCFVNYTSESERTKHVSGKEHAKRVKLLEACELWASGASGAKPVSNYCGYCGTRPDSREQLVQHLNSPSHIAQVKRYNDFYAANKHSSKLVRVDSTTCGYLFPANKTARMSHSASALSLASYQTTIEPPRPKNDSQPLCRIHEQEPSDVSKENEWRPESRKKSFLAAFLEERATLRKSSSFSASPVPVAEKRPIPKTFSSDSIRSLEAKPHLEPVATSNQTLVENDVSVYKFLHVRNRMLEAVEDSMKALNFAELDEFERRSSGSSSDESSESDFEANSPKKLSGTPPKAKATSLVSKQPVEDRENRENSVTENWLKVLEAFSSFTVKQREQTNG